MTDKPKQSMFSDRRAGQDRRQQSLPMPQGLDRRQANTRRSRHFQAQPWWLKINYAAELISENTVIESGLTANSNSKDSPPASQK